MKAKVDFTEIGDISIVTYHGEMTFFFLEEVENYLKNMIRDKKYKIIFDMTHVSWVDSMGLGLIAMVVKFALLNGKKVCMVNVKENIYNLLRLSTISDLINVYDNINEAVEFLKQ